MLGYFDTHRVLEGGGALNVPANNSRNVAAARRARRQTKVHDETLQVSTKNLNLNVMGRIKVKVNAKIRLSATCTGISRYDDIQDYAKSTSEVRH